MGINNTNRYFPFESMKLFHYIQQVKKRFQLLSLFRQYPSLILPILHKYHTQVIQICQNNYISYFSKLQNINKCPMKMLGELRSKCRRKIIIFITKIIFTTVRSKNQVKSTKCNVANLKFIKCINKSRINLYLYICSLKKIIINKSTKLTLDNNFSEIKGLNIATAFSTKVG